MMTHSSFDVSVVICTYSEMRWDDLVACVDSVRQQTIQCREIIVVVDHNPDLLDRVRSQLPMVVAIPNRQAAGLAGARNTGVHAASSSIIAFLDDDALAATDWLARLADGYADPHVMGVGGAIAPLWTAGRPNWFPEEFNWVVGCTYRGLPIQVASVRNLIGANMSFRKCIFEDVGGFQVGMGGWTESGLACEETVFCIRTLHRIRGSKLLYEPRARVSHRVPRTRTRASYFFARCFTEGISKAVVSKMVGSSDGLASERNYTLHVLPQGVMHGIGDALHGDLTGLGRAGAIGAGLATTTVGFLRGMLANQAVGMQRPPSGVSSRDSAG